MKVELSAFELHIISSLMAEGLKSLERKKITHGIVVDGDNLRNKIIHWIEYGVKAE